MEFSTNLLKQFIEDFNEDLDTLANEINDDKKHVDSQDSYQDNIKHALSIMQVFNTVLSCIKKTPPETKTVLDEESLSWFDTVLRSLFIVTGIEPDEAPNCQIETSKNIGGEFEENLLISGLQATIMLLEMCPDIHSTNANDNNISVLYVVKNKELSTFLQYILHHYLSFSRQGQICVLHYILQMQNLAAELGVQDHNMEENIVQQILNSGIILNAAFSTAKVSCRKLQKILYRI